MMRPLSGSARLLNKLHKFCHPWRSLIIAIDGQNGSGKSSLGRYLSWQLGMPLIETDFWIISTVPVEHKIPEVRKLVRKRLNQNKPVIVEGVTMLRMLEHAKLTPDFLVLITNKRLESSPDVDEDDECNFPPCLSLEVKAYLKKYRPQDKADRNVSTTLIQPGLEFKLCFLTWAG